MASLEPFIGMIEHKKGVVRMINLIQAVRLLGLRDDDFVYFCCRPQDRYSQYMSVAKMRKYLDMKAIRVHRIGTNHFVFAPEVTIEFIVSLRDVQHISDMARKEW